MSLNRRQTLALKSSVVPNPNLSPGFASAEPQYPLPSDPSGVYSCLNDQHLHDLTASKKKFVKVSGNGIIEIEPDKIEFCIKITSTKADLKECRSSVKKREDYIMAVMKKIAVREQEIKSNEMVSKTTDDQLGVEDEALRKTNSNNNVNVNNGEAGGNDNNTAGKSPPYKKQQQKGTMYTVVKELVARVSSIAKYFQIYSICTEKLDFRVVVSEPIIGFTSELLDKSVENALKVAVQNSRAKAEHLISSNNNRINHTSSPSCSSSALGSLIYTIENYLTVENLSEFQDTTANTFESFKLRKHSKLIKTQISSVYEILPCEKEKPRKAVI